MSKLHVLDLMVVAKYLPDIDIFKLKYISKSFETIQERILFNTNPIHDISEIETLTIKFPNIQTINYEIPKLNVINYFGYECSKPILTIIRDIIKYKSREILIHKLFNITMYICVIDAVNKQETINRIENTRRCGNVV